MVFYKFEPDDIFTNTIKVYPKIEFFIYSGSVYYNNTPKEVGEFASSVLMMTGGMDGHPGVSLYEMNVDRPEDSKIYSFLAKGSSRESFRTISTGSFDSLYQYGTEISMSYPLTASISREFISSGENNKIRALRNTIDHYRILGGHYDSETFLESTTETNLVNIPSIFYGSSIDPGTVDIKFFVTGSYVGRLRDTKQNGELIEYFNSSGERFFGDDITSDLTASTQGIILYNEGLILLTGSSNLSTTTQENYDQGVDNPQWVYWGSTGSAGDQLPSSSFYISFDGVDYIQTLTMMAHAPRNELNHSSNPTFVDYNLTSSHEIDKIRFRSRGGTIKNTVYSDYPDPTGSFKKQVYISKIGIYDEDKNLIAIAKLASPVRKRESDNFTFKLKLDI